MLGQFIVLDVYYIHYIKHALGKWNLINRPGFWNLGWSAISMVTIHETEMIFLQGKTSVWICPARLWQVIWKYISLCDGALRRHDRGSSSEECLKVVLEQALESSYFWTTKKIPFMWSSFTENFIHTFYHKLNFSDLKDDPCLFVTGTPCSWSLVLSSFCLGSPKNLSVPIELGDATLRTSSDCTSEFHPCCERWALQSGCCHRPGSEHPASAFPFSRIRAMESIAGPLNLWGWILLFSCLCVCVHIRYWHRMAFVPRLLPASVPKLL